MNEFAVVTRAKSLLRSPSVTGFEDSFFGVLAAVVCQRFGSEQVVAYDPQTGKTLATGTVAHAAHCGKNPVDLVVTEFSKLGPGVPVGFEATDSEDTTSISGQLDNALSVAMAIELLNDGFDGTVLFTAGEEAGVSWKPLVDWFGHPTDRLVVLDTSPFDDSGLINRGVVVLRARDAGGQFSATATARMAAAAQSASTEVVWKDKFLQDLGRPLGRTELGRVIAATKGSVTGTTLQIQTTDYHTNYETTSLRAIAAVGRTLEAFLE